MKTYKIYVKTNLVGSKVEDEFETDATNEDLEKEAFSFLSDSGMFEWGFYEVEE